MLTPAKIIELTKWNIEHSVDSRIKEESLIDEDGRIKVKYRIRVDEFLFSYSWDEDKGKMRIRSYLMDEYVVIPLLEVKTDIVENDMIHPLVWNYEGCWVEYIQHIFEKIEKHKLGKIEILDKKLRLKMIFN